jgi:indolepyruvate ferredoxin oxidoreductase
MKQRIRDEVGADEVLFLDATRIATALLGDSIAANLFLLGVAYQRGLVPVSAAALEEAVAMNGVAVEFNRQAFLFGRRFANRPEQVLALVPEKRELPQLSTQELIEDRAARLVAYQDEAYAQRYRDTLAPLQAADPEPAGDDSLTATAARALYKLMAYKDEYEVARLYSSDEFLAGLNRQFEGDFGLRFNLAPPLLSRRDPSTGLPAKREFGAWMLTAFRLLAPLRRLRGTPLDLFGYTAERRRERQDIADYEALIARLLPEVGRADKGTLRELLGLPLQLRGFGHVKDRNRDQLGVRRTALLARISGEEQPVQIVEAA